MLDRLYAIRSIGGKALVGAVLASTLLLAACGGSTSTSTSTSANSSLMACSVSASDIAPTSTAAGTPTKVSGLSGQKITADGSSALQPLVKQAAAEFDKANGTVSTISAGGSGQGLKDVAAGAVQIGDSDVFAASKLSASAAASLTDHQVAGVIFTLVVNNDLKGKVGNLTKVQIQGIYTGQYTNWSQLGGPNEAITVVNRPTTSGTRATFKQYVLEGKNEISGNTLTQDNTGAVAQAVSGTPGAIGYVSDGFAASSQYSSQVAPICIDGGKPTEADVDAGKYIFWNIEHAYTKGPATGAAKALLQYVESSTVQTNDVPALSFIQISKIPANVIQTHTPSGAPAPESFYQS